MLKIVFPFLLIIFTSTSLFADAGNVRFSYQKVEIGTKKDWVLVPMPTKSIEGTASKTTIMNAFKALKKDKRSTYGSSTISIKGSSPASAKVSVKIPANKMPYAIIIIAETVYTMTEMGVNGVSFPGYTTSVLKRKDVPFAAYTLVMPLWKILPNIKSKSILVQLPNGKIEPSIRVIKKWATKDSEIRQQLYSYLKSSDPYTVGSVAKLLPKLRLPYVDQVLPLLKHKSPSIRKSAMKILEAKSGDDKVLASVLNVMKKDKNSKVVLAAADFLSKSKNPKYSVQMTYYLLEKGTEKQKIAAIMKLGASKATPETLKILNAKLASKKKMVALTSVRTLSKLNESSTLNNALFDKGLKIKDEIKLVIAKALAGKKEKSIRVKGLSFIASVANLDQALSAIEKLGAIRHTSARQSLEALLNHRDQKRNLEALHQLSKRGEIETLPALVKLKKKYPRKVENAGYAILRTQKLDVISTQTKSSNKYIQRLAFRALGEIAAKKGKSAKIFVMLKTGTKNNDAGIRGASARAIGRYANKDAENILKSMLKDRDANVRADVAYAIGFLKEGVFTDQLVKMISDKNPAIQAGAISALGRRGETFAWDKIKKLGSHKDERVRASVLSALSNLISRSDKKAVRDVISLLSGRVSDKSKFVQEAAIKQLGTFNDESALTAIALRLNDTHEPLQLAAIEAIGNTKHGSAADLLVNMLDDTNRRVRLATIMTLIKLKEKSSKRGIEKRLKIEKDAEVKKALQNALKVI